MNLIILIKSWCMDLQGDTRSSGWHHWMLHFSRKQVFIPKVAQEGNILKSRDSFNFQNVDLDIPQFSNKLHHVNLHAVNDDIFQK